MTTVLWRYISFRPGLSQRTLANGSARPGKLRINAVLGNLLSASDQLSEYATNQASSRKAATLTKSDSFFAHQHRRIDGKSALCRNPRRE